MIRVVTLVALAAGTSGEAVSFLREGLTDTLYVAQPDKNSTFLGPLRAVSTTAVHPSPASDNVAILPTLAPWFVAQWNSPHPLLGHADSTINSACDAVTTTWSATTASSRICRMDVGGGRSAYQMATSGGDALQCGKEFDFFLAPVGSAHPQYVPTFLGRNDSVYPFSKLDGLRVAFNVSLDYSSITKRCSQDECGPSPDYSYLVLGVPLSNRVSKETIFYQVSFWDSRSLVCPKLNTCSPTTPNGTWYFSTLPTLGVNYHIGSFPAMQCFLKAGQRRSYDFANLLHTMKNAIAYASWRFGADGDLEHWTVGSIYIGSGMQGAAVITYTLSDVEV
eukprot:Hpha_TRINITY_DN17319_c0_g1::TRINITY_DN17319_c0_g1_i1::g.137992::m.137992